MAEITPQDGTVQATDASVLPASSGTSATTSTATTTGAGQEPATDTAQPDDRELTLTKAELERVRRENAAARKKIQEYETAQLTAEQQREQRLAELEAENTRLANTAKQRAIEAAIVQAATAQGVKATLAVKLVDEAKIAFDDNGNVTNAADLVKLLAQENPELIVRNGGGIGNPGRTGAEDAVAHEAHLRQILGGGHGSPFSVEVARANPVVIPGR
jgi:hypothetical protein